MGERLFHLGAAIFRGWGRIATVIVSAAALIGATAPAAEAATNTLRQTTRHVRTHHRRTKRPATHHSPSAPAQCANANASATSASVDAIRAAVVCLINQQRSKRGLPALTVSSQLNQSAQAWNDAMVATGNFTHGPGDAFATRISAAGYDWQYAGENIAAGFLTPGAAIRAWMGSPDHCRNILDPHFRNVGTGVSAGSTGGYGSGTWTQDFGLLMSQSPLSSNTGPQRGCPY